MVRSRETDPTRLALRIERRLMNFITRVGRPVAWSEIRGTMSPCTSPDIRAVLQSLAHRGVLKHATRREYFSRSIHSRIVDRDYWELAVRNSETTDNS
jgi:hypothetical protein